MKNAAKVAKDKRIRKMCKMGKWENVKIGKCKIQIIVICRFTAQP